MIVISCNIHPQASSLSFVPFFSPFLTSSCQESLWTRQFRTVKSSAKAKSKLGRPGRVASGQMPLVVLQPDVQTHHVIVSQCDCPFGWWIIFVWGVHPIFTCTCWFWSLVMFGMVLFALLHSAAPWLEPRPQIMKANGVVTVPYRKLPIFLGVVCCPGKGYASRQGLNFYLISKLIKNHTQPQSKFYSD